MEITLFQITKIINIILAFCLIGYSVFVVLSLGGFNPLVMMMAGYYMYSLIPIFLSFSYSIFGFLMIMSHCKFEFIKRNFYLLCTVKGRGAFNIL